MSRRRFAHADEPEGSLAKAPVSQFIADQVRSGQTTVLGVRRRPGDTAGFLPRATRSTGLFEPAASILLLFPGDAAIPPGDRMSRRSTDLGSPVHAGTSSHSQQARPLRAGPR